ncbi:MAG: hypothetical protein Q4G04_01440 [bacterium]|nr:hypothetical protein [bacterium]
MNKNSPNIVLVCKFNLGINNIDNQNKTGLYKESRNNSINKMLNYYSNEEKIAVGMLDYFTGKYKDKRINLVLENGRYATKYEFEKRKEEYKNYIDNSNLWKCVLSFNNDYIDSKISLRDLEKKVATEVMPRFLKYCGFKDIDKMTWSISLHCDTDNYHLHFAFMEKEANYVSKRGNISYRRKGKLSTDEKNFFKRQVALAIERESVYAPLLTKTNKDIDELKTFFNPNEKNFMLSNIKNIEIEEKIITLGKLLKQYRSLNNNKSKNVKYNSIKNNQLGKDIKILTNDIKKDLFQNKESTLYKQKETVLENIKKLNDYYNILNKENNIKEEIKSNKLIEQKQDYINNYILNSIVNYALNGNKKSLITLDNVIQEIALTKTKKLKNNSLSDIKKNVLLNYFNNSNKTKKYKYKYEMEKALKNINNEMDEAAEKFSELFNYDIENTRQ